MKFECVVNGAKVLNIEKKTNQDGSINWNEVVILQGANCNTLTIDSKTTELVKVGQTYDLVVNVTEQPKAYRNGNGAYIENKFKVIGVYSK